MAVLCFPQCHHSSPLPTGKHVKSLFILLIGFNVFENAFPCLMSLTLQDVLAAELGTGGAMYTIQMDDLGQEGVFLPLKFALLPASVLCKYFWHV